MRAIQAVLYHVADRLVADLLVDVVGGRIRDVGKEEAEPATCIELQRARGPHAGARVAPPAKARRRVDRPDPNAVEGLTPHSAHGHDLAAFPETHGSGTARGPAVRGLQRAGR